MRSIAVVDWSHDGTELLLTALLEECVQPVVGVGLQRLTFGLTS